MMEVLRFVFSSFWVWLGTAVLLGMVCVSVSDVLRAAVLVLIGKRP